MPKHVVGLVTLFHPDIYLSNVHKLPHIDRTRAAMTSKLHELEKAGKVRLHPDYRDAPFVDSGSQIRPFKNRLVRGSEYANLLAEPRIIHTPDEPNPKAKWKVEFRREWPDETGRMDETVVGRLTHAIRSSSQVIVGLWVNPTVSVEKFSEPYWVNLVVSAVKQVTNAPYAPVRFFSSGQGLWCDWDG
jgi:hypothetical protein